MFKVAVLLKVFQRISAFPIYLQDFFHLVPRFQFHFNYDLSRIIILQNSFDSFSPFYTDVPLIIETEPAIQKCSVHDKKGVVRSGEGRERIEDEVKQKGLGEVICRERNR